jgi:hypothetical protein
MKKLVLLSLLLFAVISLQAQAVIDTAILKKFSPSVITKVYSIAKTVSLSKSKQQELAELFRDEEIAVSAAILNNQSASDIKTLQSMYKYELHAALPNTTLDSFYKATVANKALERAEQTVKLLSYKYGYNIQLLNHFKTIHNWQESQLEYMSLRYIDDSIRKQNILSALYTYDTLLNRYKEYGDAAIFLNQQITKIKAAQTVDTNRIKNLADSFFSTAINNKNIPLQKHFDDAMHKIFTTIADSVYYKSLYQQTITEAYNKSLVTVLNTYIRANKISDYTTQKLLPIIAERERKIAIVQAVFTVYNPQQHTLVNTITQAYQPQIDSLLVRDINFESNSQIDIAIRLATDLVLPLETIQNLENASNQLNEMKLSFKNENPDAEFDSKTFESEILNSYLSEDQYTTVLVAKYGKQAQNMMKADWDKIVREGLNSQYDSANTKLELTNYHTAILVAYHRYANDKEKQYTNIRMLQEIMPEVLRLLYDKWNYKTPYGDAADSFFQW